MTEIATGVYWELENTCSFLARPCGNLKSFVAECTEPYGWTSSLSLPQLPSVYLLRCKTWRPTPECPELLNLQKQNRGTQHRESSPCPYARSWVHPETRGCTRDLYTSRMWPNQPYVRTNPYVTKISSSQPAGDTSTSSTSQPAQMCPPPRSRMVTEWSWSPVP